MLLRDHLAGRTDSFELLVRRHIQDLHQFAYRFTGNTVAAEDVVQETFLQLYISARGFDCSRRLKPWLYAIAANKARDYLRRRDRKREVPFEAELAGQEESGKRFIELLSEETTPPDEGWELEEKRKLVKAVVESLPPSWREILILAYYHRFSYKEISEIAGISMGTVKSRLHTAVVSFARAYREAVRVRAQGKS
jgi:RNA polymerase sigma-70 factor (ECF subfamily)